MAGAQGRLLEEEGFAGMGCSGELGITGATRERLYEREREPGENPWSPVILP